MKNLYLLGMLTLVCVAVAGVSALACEAPNTNCQGLFTKISGTVTDLHTGLPVVGTPVEVYCQHKDQVNSLSTEKTTTNETGGYTVLTFNILGSRKCVKGDTAWIKVNYGGAVYESEHVTLECLDKDTKPKVRYNGALVNTTVGAPEFTTITLTLAVAGAGLGLVLLRKNY